MSGRHEILCGGLGPPGMTGKGIVTLNVAGPARNVLLRISDICHAMTANVPDVLADLLELAAYVFAADQAVGRGGAHDTGERWRRHLTFRVPVRLPEVWSRVDVKEALTEVLSFLSDDDYDLSFTRLQQEQPVQRYFETVAPDFDADEVALFSGGLDSLGGAAQAAIEEERRVVLVTHRAATKRVPAVERLVRDLGAKCGQRVRCIQVRATKTEEVGREYTQRTRSFLYASLAAATAHLLRLDRIRFYENGVTSLNLPIAPQVLGGRATRTTHPQTLAGFARLFSLILDRPFGVENPFLWLTKTDVVRRVKDVGCAELVRASVSCSHVVESTRLYTHCGRCSQCLDRRFATLAAGLTEDQDPPEMYKIPLLTGARAVGEERTMAESFVRRALDVREMDELQFLTAYPEATRAVRHVGLPPGEAARRVHLLFARHGEDVAAVLADGLRQEAAEFQAGTLPDTCILALAVPERYRHLQATIRVPTFRRSDDHWSIWFANEETTLKDGVGPRYVALLLDNPGRRMHVMDMLIAEALLNGELDPTLLPEGVGDPEEGGFAVRKSPAGSGGTLFDYAAKLDYRVRLDRLEEDGAAARAAGGDPVRTLEIEQEAAQIKRLLRAGVDIRGKLRPGADDDERARQSVTRAVNRTILHLGKRHPSLSRHLRKHLSTGLFCKYDPDPPVYWVTK